MYCLATAKTAVHDTARQEGQEVSLAQDAFSPVPAAAVETGAMFTPVESAIGGMLIGLSAAISYLVDGRIAGVAGILGPFLRGATQLQPLTGGQLWKILFLLGLVLGGLIAMACNHDFSFPQAAPFHVVRYIAAAVFVGMGTRIGKGCTSGHGICGLPRFSSRSWVAVPTFMGMAIATVALTRHAFKWEQPRPWAVAELQWPPKWEFPVASLGASALLTFLMLALPTRIQRYVSPTLAGIIFGPCLSVS